MTQPQSKRKPGEDTQPFRAPFLSESSTPGASHESGTVETTRDDSSEETTGGTDRAAESSSSARAANVNTHETRDRAPLSGAHESEPAAPLGRAAEWEAERLPSHVRDLKPDDTGLTHSADQASRSDLDYRTLVNQKDSELLTLRAEVTARDKRILELNERSVATERSRLAVWEELEQTITKLSTAENAIRSHETAEKATNRRTTELKAAFHRAQAHWKKTAQGELNTVREQHTAESQQQTDAFAQKLASLERNHAATLTRLHAQHTATRDQTEETHSQTLHAAEETANQTRTKLVSAHKEETLALKDAQAKALSRAFASHSATLDAALAEATSEKASALADVEGLHRATQSELSAIQATLGFLQRTQAQQESVIARQDSKVTKLEESLQEATTRADAATEMVTKLRRTLGAGLRILDAFPIPEGPPEPEAGEKKKEA